MPRVRGYTNEQKMEYQRKRLVEKCELLLFKSHISKTKVAEYLGVTPQAVASQFKRYKLSTDTIMAVATLTNAAPEEIGEVLKVG